MITTETKQKEEAYLEALETYNSSSFWKALYAYLTENSLEAFPEHIARLFNVSLDEALEAVDGLQKLNLMEVQKNHYVALNNPSVFHLQGEEVTEKLIEGHKYQGREILQKFSKHNGFGSNYYLTSNKKDMEWFFDEYTKLLQTLIEKGNKNSDALYAVHLSAINYLKAKGDLS